MKKIGLILALMIGLLIGSVQAEPEDNWLCRTVAHASVSRAGWVAEWDSQHYTWVGLPDDLNQVPIDILFVDEEMTAGYVLYFSPAQQELWVFPHWSFDVRTDANGEHEGTHDVCDVLVYDLNPEHR
jgi:hypothetical protein